MPDNARDAVISGREAWQRLRERERKSWADWMQVGHALRIGRDAALQAAGTNIPFSKVYTEFMADWLRTNQFDDIGQQVRYRLLECIENLRDRKWRATIDEVHLRRWNHPDSVMLHWKNSNLVHAPRHSIQGRSRSGS